MGSNNRTMHKNYRGKKRSSQDGKHWDNRLDATKIRSEIRDLAETLLAEGKQKNQWKKQKLNSLGAKNQKNVKTPYNILMGMKAAQNHREEIKNRRIQEAFGFGALKQQSRRKEEEQRRLKAINQLKGNRRGDRNTVGDGSFGFHPTVGTNRGGVLTLSRRDIDDIEGRKNPGPMLGAIVKKGHGYNRKGGHGRKSKQKKH